MLIGVSLKLRDKRVDKMLASRSFGDAEIFYSPISSWLLILVLILTSAAGLLFYLATWDYWYLIIPYSIISYLLNAFLNNSFALQDDKLFIINPNFPFRRFQIMKRDETKQITIDKVKGQWLMIFMATTGNFLSIKTTNKLYKFHCASLDQDAFDENWTEKTIEDFRFALDKNKFPTTYNL